MKTRFAIVAAAMAFAMTLSSMASAEPRQRFKPGNENIGMIAMNDPDSRFDTLVEALMCTGIIGAVTDPEAEITVFAPTDMAFMNVGLGPDNICTAFNHDELADILLYHVVGERRPSPSVIKGKNKAIEMLAGGAIYPDGGGKVTIQDNLGRTIMIETPDVLASNGIIHIVKDVLLPFAPTAASD